MSIVITDARAWRAPCCRIWWGRAHRLGYNQLVLESGCRQVAAMRLYEAHGFQRISAFGEYVDDPTSVCYGRPIDPA